MSRKTSGRRGTAVICFPALLVALLLLAGCQSESPAEPPFLPAPVQEVLGAPTMDENTPASIQLASLPPEVTVDEAGQIVVASGLPNVGVGTIVLLEGGGQDVQSAAIATYHWELMAPESSAAELTDPDSRTPSFIPDLPGLYTVQLTIANDQGDSGLPASLTIHAGTWVGNGAVRGASDDPHQCVECHRDKIVTWRDTRHAETLRRAMDGQASPYYFQDCIHCHSVGLNKIADNNGFDDVARDLNWTYPPELALGNYARLVAEVPRLANLGNTQCEACHGPGSAHEDDDDLIAVGLQPEVCIQCHDFLKQDRYAQWLRSGHADTSLPQLFPAGIDEPLCSTCHTTSSFIAAADGTEIVPGGKEDLSCQACHDPHAAPGANIYQLRYFGSVQLPDGTNMPDMGPSALCIHCHNVGETPEWVERTSDSPLTPPPQSAAAEMLAGVGGYTYNQEIGNSPHVRAVRWNGACVSCHMSSSTSEGNTDFLSASMNEPVGEHTFLVRFDNGTPSDPADDYENLRACAGCHGDIPRLNAPAAADYDGDGLISGVQDEVQGLLDLIQDSLIQAGVAWSDTAPYWGPAQDRAHRAAIYNWSYVNNDGSRGIHNTARAIELLQLTYEQLTGQPVPGATRWSDQGTASTLQQRFAAERSWLARLDFLAVMWPVAAFLLLGVVVYLVLTAIRPGKTAGE